MVVDKLTSVPSQHRSQLHPPTCDLISWFGMTRTIHYPILWILHLSQSLQSKGQMLKVSKFLHLLSCKAGCGYLSLPLLQNCLVGSLSHLVAISGPVPVVGDPWLVDQWT